MFIWILLLFITGSHSIYFGITNGEVYNNTQLLGPGSVDGTNVNALALNNSESLYVCTQGGNVWNWETSKWVQIGGQIDDTGISRIAITQDNTLYVGTYSGNIWEYNSNQKKWELSITLGGPINGLIASPSGVIIASEKTEGFFVWEYNGEEWLQLGPNQEIRAETSSIGVDSNGNIYAGIYRGSGDEYNNEIYTYSSPNWTPYGQASWNPEDNITAIVADSQGDIFAGLQGEVWEFPVTSNGWQKQNVEQWNSQILSLAIDVNGIVYAGLQNGSILQQTESSTWSIFWNKTSPVTSIAQPNILNTNNSDQNRWIWYVGAGAAFLIGGIFTYFYCHHKKKTTRHEISLQGQ